jgi:hypothetical protein
MLICMRTTLNLDDDLVARAKQEAARSRRTLTSVIEDALREALARTTGAAGEESGYRVRPFGGDGVRAGVDLDDSAGLLDLMSEPDDAPDQR